MLSAGLLTSMLAIANAMASDTRLALDMLTYNRRIQSENLTAYFSPPINIVSTWIALIATEDV